MTGAVLVLGSKDGTSLDRIVLAAMRQRLAPSRQVAAGTDGIPAAPGWLLDRVARPDSASRATSRSAVGQAVPSAMRLPAQAVGEAGVVDLGRDGLALIALASTVNFAGKGVQVLGRLLEMSLPILTKVSDFDGRPLRPVGISQRATTLRFTLSRA